MAARFITVEGMEGAGKSTHVRRLVAALEARGVPVVATREPGGSPGAEAIRRLLVEGTGDRWSPLTELLLINAARRDHVERVIHPALAAGRWVVCDRFTDSTLAYQGYGHGLGRGTVDGIRHITIGAFAPDVTVILDVPVAEGLRRVGARAATGDRFERLDEAFHGRVREGFLAIAAEDPARCAVIDAAASADAVHAAIMAALAQRVAITP